MLHYHPLTNEKGIIADRVVNLAEDFNYLSFNNVKYYYPTGCGVEEIEVDTPTELYTFEMYIKLPGTEEAQFYNFCAPPVPLKENHILMRGAGSYNCCPFAYIKRASNTVFYIKDGSHYLIPLPCFNDIEQIKDKGIMYRFEDETILNEWNYRLGLHLRRIPRDYFELQGAVEVLPVRTGPTPYHYSPLVIPLLPAF